MNHHPNKITLFLNGSTRRSGREEPSIQHDEIVDRARRADLFLRTPYDLRIDEATKLRWLRSALLLWMFCAWPCRSFFLLALVSDIKGVGPVVQTILLVVWDSMAFLLALSDWMFDLRKASGAACCLVLVSFLVSLASVVLVVILINIWCHSDSVGLWWRRWFSDMIVVALVVARAQFWMLAILSIRTRIDRRTWDRIGLPTCSGRRRRWRRLIRDAQIAWVRVGALRRWEREGAILPMRQKMSDDDCHIGSGGCRLWDHHRFVVSHPWFSPDHPDPDGDQLRKLVRELAKIHAKDSDLVFYDFCSLPQIDRSVDPPRPRTPVENRLFSMAIGGMQHLYTLPGSKILVLPDVPSSCANPRPYIERGWCYFELSISAAYLTIVNSDADNVKAVLNDIPFSTDEFKEKFRGRFH